VTIADIELANPVARYARFACDRPDEVSRLHAVAVTDADEYPREFS
jgi:hypothetical protein